MLVELNSLRGYALQTIDGRAGRVRDFLFDDESWALTYLVVRTGVWPDGRRVLIHTSHIRSPQLISREIPVDLSRERVGLCPDAEADRPVSQQSLFRIHNYLEGFGGLAGSGIGFFPIVPPPLSERERDDMDQIERTWNPRLRSVREIEGYWVRTNGGTVGKLIDAIVDDDRWVLKFVVVRETRLMFGRKFLLSTDMIGNITWANRTVHVSEFIRPYGEGRE